MSCVGLTMGVGGEGACITSKMFFGGWLYPDACSTGFAGAAVPFERGTFDSADMGADAAQTTSPPAKRHFKALRTGISLLRFTPRAKIDRRDDVIG